MVICFASAPARGVDKNSSGREFFENKVRPVLAERCLSCHTGELAQAGLRLDYRGGWEKGGKLGPVIVQDDPDKSPLIRAIRHEPPGTPMPLGSEKLSPDIISAFEQWVRMGAPDPRDSPSVAKVAEKSWSEVFSDRSRWWSLQPVVLPPVPPVKKASWSSQPVDRFILGRLEESGLEPAPKAGRATLLRRLSFVLTGLPPTPEEVAAFVNDRAPKAYTRAVDRFLGSPHFGEHWARHWMDVVRYTDTYGYEWDIPAKGAWRFRDYLIRAFNSDLAFDQFVREQIAGDLLPRPRINTREEINESLIGPMFFQLGEKRHGDSLDVNGIHQEMLNNKIDAFSKAFQGMTVACARCHDHKLDAISQSDYYALAGALMSSRWVSRTLDTDVRNRQVLEKLQTLKEKLRPEIARLWLDEAHRFPRYLRAVQAAIDQSPEAAQLAQDLDSGRLLAWKKAFTLDVAKKPALEELLYPWWQTVYSKASWSDVADAYARTRQERTAANARDFTVVADFSRGIPKGWSVDGVGFRGGPVSTGDFTVALSGPSAIGLVLPGGLYTNTLSPRLNGVLRTPYLNHATRGRISLEAAGGDFAAHRVVVSNAFLTERQVYFKESQPRWVTLSPNSTALLEKASFGLKLTEKEDEQLRIWVELATKTLNPNFPPRVGLGGECTEEQARDPRSWFGITRAVAHDKKEAPADELVRFGRLFTGKPTADSAEHYGEWLAAVVAAWSDGRAEQDEIRIVNWMLDKGLLPNRVEDGATVSELIHAYREAERQLAEPQTVNGMADLDPGYDVPINIRGVYEDLGESAPRGYVSVLSDGRSGFSPRQSGRLELAELVASPKNPLTARVFVNRVWHWLFGTGIVATTDDFGHIGERPSHPELLDYLADRFVHSGWSIKQLIRTIVLSETFQQSGLIAARSREVDPLNRLLHHYPMRRLDAESIRDTILAVSTRLDCRLYGEPVNPPRPKEDPQKRLFSGPLDSDGRRSIYIKMTIMEPPRLLATFNQPAPKIPTGRRDVTNVPAQALALLNDPFVVDQAEYWARQLIGASHYSASHASPEQRLTVMFRAAFSRDPSQKELVRWNKAIAELAHLYDRNPGNAPHGGMMNSLEVWKDVAHAIFNTKEFLYVR